MANQRPGCGPLGSNRRRNRRTVSTGLALTRARARQEQSNGRRLRLPRPLTLPAINISGLRGPSAPAHPNRLAARTMKDALLADRVSLPAGKGDPMRRVRLSPRGPFEKPGYGLRPTHPPALDREDGLRPTVPSARDLSALKCEVNCVFQ